MKRTDGWKKLDGVKTKHTTMKKKKRTDTENNTKTLDGNT